MAKERAYTVSEIDDLRSALLQRERARIWEEADIAHGDWEKDARDVAEDQLRTHMLAGHTASDIEAALREAVTGRAALREYTQ